MRYFILFFCLLFGQIATIQANYSAPQNTNYQIVSADIANPIEPIKPKKARLQSKDWGSEEWANLAIVCTAIFFFLGLIFFPPAFVGGILWLCQLSLGLEAFGLLLSITMFFVFRRLYKGSKNWGEGVIVASFILVPLLFFILKGIELIYLGITLSILSLWIIGIPLIILPIIFYLIALN